MITVIGLGFVGLTTALGFADKGHKVYGLDINQEKTVALKKGIIPFLEPHLKEILAKQINQNFFIVDSLKEAIGKSESIFICVGTPNDDQGKVDLAIIYNVIEYILKEIKKGDFKVLVIKSTIPPSTTKEKIAPFVEQQGFTVR